MPNDEGHNDQIAAARWHFIKAVRRFVPGFFAALRAEICPAYEQLAATEPFWMIDRKFETLQKVAVERHEADPLVGALMAWAREFNIDGEPWVLDGALQTLAEWRRSQKLKDALDPWAFLQQVCVSAALEAEGHRFEFKDWGWDPTFVSWLVWRKHVRERFEGALDTYERSMRKLVEDRGAVRTGMRFSKDHFEWLARDRCGKESLKSILSDAPMAGDETTIYHGVRRAAQLAGMKDRPRHRKLKNP